MSMMVLGQILYDEIFREKEEITNNQEEVTKNHG